MPSLPYEYSSIDVSSRVFRAIKLLPPISPDLPQTLRVQIIHINCDQVIPYDALSYTWGVANDAVPDRKIMVETADGKRDLHIHRPLENALLQLLRDKVTHRPLFVDQISINQLDPSEKDHQVPLMRDIYAGSERVVVWLGTSERPSDDYFDFLRDVCSDGIMSRVMGPNVGHFPKVSLAVTDPSIELTEVEREDRDDVLSLVLRHGPKLPFDGMINVMSRHWFTRLWIVQEVSLGRDVTFVCGSRSLCFDCFRTGVLFYGVYAKHWLPNIKSAVSQNEMRRRYDMLDLTLSFTRIFQERKAIHLFKRRQTLYDLLLKYSVSGDGPRIEASVPEDRIFGLMGMAEEDEMLRVIRSRVRYKQTVVIYTETAGMMARQNLDVLCFSQFPKKVEGLPSWVPDWSTDLAIPHGYVNLSTPVFKAGGEGKAEFELDSDCLLVRGSIVDNITLTGQCTLRKRSNFRAVDLIDYPSTIDFMDEIEKFLDMSNRIPHERVQSHGLPFAAAFRLSDFGLSAKEYEETMASNEALLTANKVYAQAYRLGQNFQVAGSEESSLIKENSPDVGATAHLKDINFDCMENSDEFKGEWFDPSLNGSSEMSTYTDNLYKNIGSRLYLTRLGYVGLGPPGAKGGDAVVVLNGSTVPHILRVESGSGPGGGDSRWSYVGEAYCDGIMDGEFLTSGKPPDSVVFKIC